MDELTKKTPANYAEVLQVQVGIIGGAITTLEVAAFNAGEQMVDEFIERRTDLRKQAQAEADQRARANNTKPKLIWCQLNPFARYRNDSLEIGWSCYNIHHKKGSHTSIKKSKRNYDLRTLQSLAKPFEADLIVEFEARARILRDHWKNIIVLRRMLRNLTNDTNKHANQPLT